MLISSQATVAVVTDSTACIPRELVREYGISIVPMTFSFRDTIYRDDPDAPTGEFYRLLEEEGELPATSLASPGAFSEMFTRLAKEHNQVLCVTLASKLSGLYNSALLAAYMVKDSSPSLHVQVVDSQTATMGQGFLVLEAVRAAKEGKTLAEVKRAAEALAPKVRAIAVMDTLKYLVKSGRVLKLGGIAANLIGVKPMLEIASGEVRFLGVARSKPRALERLLQIMKDAGPSGATLHAAVMHANVPDEAEALKEDIARSFDCKELYISQFTPIIGMYAGPGVLAIAYYYE